MPACAAQTNDKSPNVRGERSTDQPIDLHVEQQNAYDASPQVHHPRVLALHNVPNQPEPPPRLIQDPGVGGDDHHIARRQLWIGTQLHVDRPSQPPFGRHSSDHPRETPTVTDRLIEQPVR
ncbi:MAG: hypothetical protein ACI9MC_001077 [Kiritimatiellia bacterium]|jgi:hypothetical protein